MHLPDGSAAGAAAAACIAGALLLPSPAAAADPLYPPPTFGGGAGVVSTTFSPPDVQRAPATLPSTGRDVRVLVGLGSLALTGGTLTLVLARRRRTT